MRITEKIIKNLIRQSLLESSAEWFNSDDFDFHANSFSPASSDYLKSDRVLVFDDQDIYDLQGMTHGRDSHVLKHLIEFDENIVVKQCLGAISFLNNAAASGLKIGAINFSGKKIDNINPNSLEIGDIINTFDRIQDDLILGLNPVSEIEFILYEKYFQPLISLYENIVNDLMLNSTDLNDISFSTVQDVINYLTTTNNPVISFVANFEQRLNIYHYRISDSALMVQNENGSIATLMRTKKFKQGIVDKGLDLVRSLSPFCTAVKTGKTKLSRESGYTNLDNAIKQLIQQKDEEAARAKEELAKQKQINKLLRNIKSKYADKISVKPQPSGSPLDNTVEEWYQNLTMLYNAEVKKDLMSRASQPIPWKQLHGQIKGSLSAGKNYVDIVKAINNRLKRNGQSIAIKDLVQYIKQNNLK